LAVEICCVQVGTLKRFATGTGRAQKVDMARALASAEPGLYHLAEDLTVIRIDGNPMDDDQVDAIWLARFTMAVDRGEQAFLSGFERKSARKQEKRAKRAARKAKKKARRQAAIIAARAERKSTQSKVEQGL
jgi:hypothetical protein